MVVTLHRRRSWGRASGNIMHIGIVIHHQAEKSPLCLVGRICEGLCTLFQEEQELEQSSAELQPSPPCGDAVEGSRKGVRQKMHLGIVMRMLKIVSGSACL